MGDNEAQLKLQSNAKYVVMKEIKPATITYTSSNPDGSIKVEIESVQNMVTYTRPLDFTPYEFEQPKHETFSTIDHRKTYAVNPLLSYEVISPINVDNESKEENKKENEETEWRIDFVKKMKIFRVAIIIAMLTFGIGFDIHLFRHEFDKLLLPIACIIIQAISLMIVTGLINLINKEE